MRRSNLGFVWWKITYSNVIVILLDRALHRHNDLQKLIIACSFMDDLISYVDTLILLKLGVELLET